MRVSLSMCTALLCCRAPHRTVCGVHGTALHCVCCGALHCTVLPCTVRAAPCTALCVLCCEAHCVCCALPCPALCCTGREEHCSAGGGVTRKPVFATPPPSLLGRRDGRGEVRAGAPDLPCRGGGGVNPTSMAQNDTHIALIILTTQMWGGKLLVEKTFSGQICVPVPLAPTSVLTQNKGPDTEPHFSNPPPFLRRASMSTPPPRPAEQFSGCPGHRLCAHTKGHSTTYKRQF